MVEFWKDVCGYENYYQVSNFGRVRSKPRMCFNGRVYYCKKPKILTPQPNNNGYLRIQLVNGEERKRHYVHRLVATAFIDNGDNKREVNHIDSNFLNNKVDNLEWVTHKENHHHAFINGRLDNQMKKWVEGLRKHNAKTQLPVVAYHPVTKQTLRFNSIQEAGRNGFNAGGVCECCKGTRGTHKGFLWHYEKEHIENEEPQ
jgi:hypothetical protein